VWKCLVGTLSRTVFLAKCALHRKIKDRLSDGPRQSPPVEDVAPPCAAPMALPRPPHQRPRRQVLGSRPHNKDMQIPTSWPRASSDFVVTKSLQFSSRFVFAGAPARDHPLGDDDQNSITRTNHMT